jgi:hypothetical protein
MGNTNSVNWGGDKGDASEFDGNNVDYFVIFRPKRDGGKDAW